MKRKRNGRIRKASKYWWNTLLFIAYKFIGYRNAEKQTKKTVIVCSVDWIGINEVN